MSKLVIVESPAKAKKIQGYLGKGFTVKASKGHVSDLPKSGLAVDVENDFSPEYVVTKPTVVTALKKDFKGKDTLVLAVDPDREGEAIGWHVARELGVITPAGNVKKGKKLERIVFTEITESAVKEAASSPRKLDMNLVNAQQARRILDRLVGYKLSPLLWKKIRYGLSAGRVQSVAVKLIVDRERERQAFDPDEYWKVKADLEQQKPKGKIDIKIIEKDSDKSEDEEDEAKDKDKEVRLFELSKISGKKVELSKKTEVEKVLKDLELEKYVVDDINSKVVHRKPSAPFSTSVLQQTAVQKLGFAARRTMQAAQKLYEAGHITYMRTDSLTMSKDAVSSVRALIKKKYGDQYLPKSAIEYKTKSKVAQEAHEAIRPTDFSKTASALDLDGDQAKLYTLIRTRAIASQMEQAKLESTGLYVKAGKYLLQLRGSRVVFDGYLKVYSEGITESSLPEYKVGEELFPKQLMGTQHFTQPPGRYSEATLIKALEQLGIGRPSTYAPIIHTIQQRKYVEKEGRYFIPTDTGMVVTDLLSKYFADIVDVDFTSEMEEKLDDIANGDVQWVKMLNDFYGGFEKELEKNEDKIKRDEFTVLGDAPKDMKCPVCKGKMIIKLGRYGRFYSCKKFPDCDGMRSIDGLTEEDVAKKANSKEFLAEYQPAPKTEDGKDYILKSGRFGEFWAHPDYPKVKDAKPLELLPAKMEELYGEIPKTEDGRNYLLKSGRFGKFWAHPDYPKVKDIQKVKLQKKD